MKQLRGVGNIIELLDDMVVGNEAEQRLVLILEYMPFDLSGLMTIPHFSRDMDLEQAKGLMKQLLTGLAALEERGIMHRDIKGTQIFVL